MSKGKKSKITDSQKRPTSKSKSRANFLAEFQRKQDVRDLAKRFLIVCEDEKSAPKYFEALMKYFKLSATSVRVVGSSGRSQPIQVVDRAIEIKDEADESKSNNVPFDEVWCVIDGEYGVAINNARFRANANNVKLAVSTMCFFFKVLTSASQSKVEVSLSLK